MIVRVIRWSTEAVVGVQEFEVTSDTKLVVFETMADVRVRTLTEYGPPVVQNEEPH